MCSSDLVAQVEGEEGEDAGGEKAQNALDKDSDQGDGYGEVKSRHIYLPSNENLAVFAVHQHETAILIIFQKLNVHAGIAGNVPHPHRLGH